MSYPSHEGHEPNAAPEQPTQIAPTAWPKHSQSAQPPAYGTPPALSPASTGSRPVTVEAAAVLAFIRGALHIIGGAGFLYATIFEIPQFNCQVWLFIIFDVAGAFVLAGLFIWGGVAALRGHTYKILFWTASAQVILDIISMAAVKILGYVAFYSFLFIVFPIAMIILILTRSSRDSFRARGSTPT
jgi:hypothetical protein